MRTSAFELPDIPPTFWEHPDIVRALAERDMGALFRLLKQHAGISRMRVGTAVGISEAGISNVVNGKRRIAEKQVFERIASGLGMPDQARHMLGVSARQDPASYGQIKGPAVRPGQHTELLYRISASRHIDAEVITALWNETNAIRLLDRRLGAPTISAKLQAHIDHVDSCLRYSLLPGQRRALAPVLADASALAGWQAIDMGRLTQAWDHFERATAAAREGADPCLLAFAAGEQAYVLLDLGRSADALDVVRAVWDETHAAIPHQIRGWLRAAEAEMAAAAGDEITCRHALDAAAREIGHGPSNEEHPYIALNDAHFARWRGSCLVQLGDPETAEELATALAAMDGTFARAEAGLRADLAQALYVRGERHEARRHLSRARELAQLTGSARQRRRLRDLAKRIGAAA
jgi:tetratricopeptide (TPR) repeat protein